VGPAVGLDPFSGEEKNVLGMEPWISVSQTVLWDENRCFMKKPRNQRNHRLSIKFEFSMFDPSLRYSSYKNFIEFCHLFLFDKWGTTKHNVFCKYLLSWKVFHDQKFGKHCPTSASLYPSHYTDWAIPSVTFQATHVIPEHCIAVNTNFI
jgi:hypothetical protein